MQWSSAKTQRLVFKYINCREPHPPRAIMFGGDQILPMKTSISLGVVFNAECIFYAQIKKVEDFINMMTSQIKKNVKNRSKELLKKIYNSYMLPKITYCSQVWHTGVEKHMRGIQKAVNNFWKLSYSEETPKEFMEPKLELVLYDLVLLHKIYHGHSPLKFDEMFKTSNNSTRQNAGKKIEIPTYSMECTKHRFSIRVRHYWNFLPLRIREMAIQCFKREARAHIQEHPQSYLNFGLETPIAISIYK
jgi:hypothetical protein